MNSSRIGLGTMTGATGILTCILVLGSNTHLVSGEDSTEKQGIAEDRHRVSVDVARDRAKLMHEIYSATLDSMHRHYFRREGAVLPARAMEDVFAEIDRGSNIKSRWIAVNTRAMSINHEPESEFEKKAATVLATGKPEYDRVEKGFYHRASAIPLGNGCVGCHTKFAATTDKTPRFAGLVISIPVKDK